jgi:hypothetical protein
MTFFGNPGTGSQDSVIGVLLVPSDIIARRSNAEHRVNLVPLLGHKPACVREHGETTVWVKHWEFDLNFAPGASDCGLIVQGRFTHMDTASGTWMLPSFAGSAGGGSWRMQRRFTSLFSEGTRARGFGRSAWSPIEAGGGDSVGSRRIENYILELRWMTDSVTVPSYRLLGQCCGDPAPDNGPIDVYEVSWSFRDSENKPYGWVDTLYFSRFPMPRYPLPYNNTLW